MSYFPHPPEELTPISNRALVLGMITMVLIFLTVTVTLRQRLKQERTIYWGTGSSTAPALEYDGSDDDQVFDAGEENACGEYSSRYRRHRWLDFSGLD